MGIKLLKNNSSNLYGRLKVICKNDDDLLNLKSAVKRLSDDRGMQFGLEKKRKVTF